MLENQNNLWIFGYGSLIWRADFSYSEKRPAFIKGMKRRFWQGSTDHRGLPGAPGRVVTLVNSRADICWGMAYKLHDESRDKVLDSLDYREKGGYVRLQLALHFDEPGVLPIDGITYHADAGNPEYLGEATHAQIAQQIFTSTGPSGTNSDYVFNLEQALYKLGKVDPHVVKIADEIRKLCYIGTTSTS